MGTQTWNNLDIQKRTSSSCLSQNPVEVSGGFPVDFTVILTHYFSETTSQNARQKHTYPFFSSSKVSSWPSAFILTSARNGCCVPKRQRLLLTYNHNYEHIQKHKWFPWKLQLTLNHFSPPFTGESFNLQTRGAGEGRDRLWWLPARAHRWDVVLQLVTWWLRGKDELGHGSKSWCWGA